MVVVVVVVVARDHVEGAVCHRLGTTVEVAQRLADGESREEPACVGGSQRLAVADPQAQLPQRKALRLGRRRQEAENAVHQRSDQHQPGDAAPLEDAQKLFDVGRDAGRTDREVDRMQDADERLDDRVDEQRRRLETSDVVRTERKPVPLPRDPIHQHPMCDLDALRDSGTARGIDDGQEIWLFVDDFVCGQAAAQTNVVVRQQRTDVDDCVA